MLKTASGISAGLAESEDLSSSPRRREARQALLVSRVSADQLLEEDEDTYYLDSNRNIAGTKGAADADRPKRSLRAHSLARALPHLFLIAVSAIYICVGALVFIQIEKPHVDQEKSKQLQAVEKEGRHLANRLWRVKRAGGDVAELLKVGVEGFDRYFEAVYRTHKKRSLTSADLRSLNEENKFANHWSFASAVLFVATTLTTIGYGNVVPQTFHAKLFCVCYSVVGIPLLLITTADLAKFLSSLLTGWYVRYLEAKGRFNDWLKRKSNRRPEATEPADLQTTLDDSSADDSRMADYIWQHLEKAHAVRLTASLLFVLVTAYCAAGGAILSMAGEKRGFVGQFYFSFVSCMKIGFGDIYPETELGTWLALVYCLFGLVIATMCVDVLGSYYLERLHQWGRHVQATDYLALIKKAKLLRKKEERMQKHCRTLLLLTEADLRSYMMKSISEKSALPTTAGGTRSATTTADSLTKTEAPYDLRVVDITPYTIKLHWTPPARKKIAYTLKYRMKHSGNQAVSYVEDLFDGDYEIKNLKSFTIYEISLSAKEGFSQSDAVKLVQITEPESAPQNLRVSSVTPTSAMVSWAPPFKKNCDVKGYTVYYSRSVNAPFELWNKAIGRVHDNSMLLEQLQPNSHYAFCISSVYTYGHSPLSKTISLRTGDSDTEEKEAGRWRRRTLDTALGVKQQPLIGPERKRRPTIN